MVRSGLLLCIVSGSLANYGFLASGANYIPDPAAHIVAENETVKPQDDKQYVKDGSNVVKRSAKLIHAVHDGKVLPKWEVRRAALR